MRIEPRSPLERLDGPLYGFDLSETALSERVLAPYRAGGVITLGGRSIRATDIARIEITEITTSLEGAPLSQIRALRQVNGRRVDDWIAEHATSVTDYHITGPPGTEPPLVIGPGSGGRSRMSVGHGLRSPFFGRLAFMPAPLAIAADTITVAGFLLAAVLAAIQFTSGKPRASAAPTIHTTATIPKTPQTQSSTGTGQVGQGDIYRVSNVTRDTRFALLQDAQCGDTVAFRVRIQNGGPAILHHVRVNATLIQDTAETSHASAVRVSASNNLHDESATASATVQTRTPSRILYIPRTTALLNYGVLRSEGGGVVAKLPNGVLRGGVDVGSIGPLHRDLREVQFEAIVEC